MTPVFAARIAPTPPPPQQGDRVNPGADIGAIVRNAVRGGLSTVKVELEKELAREIRARDLMREQLTALPSGSARRRLEDRIEESDRDIEKLQEGIRELGEKTGEDATAPGILIPPTLPQLPRQPDFDPSGMVQTIMLVLFIGFPLAIAFARIVWRRTAHPAPQQMNPELARRFDRVEQSVDSIAIEIERISENQRYLTKLLAEPRQAASVGSGKPNS